MKFSNTYENTHLKASDNNNPNFKYIDFNRIKMNYKNNHGLHKVHMCYLFTAFFPLELCIFSFFHSVFNVFFVLCQILDEWCFYFTHAYVYQIKLTVVTLQSTNYTFVFTLSVAACYESVYHSIVYYLSQSFSLV